MSSPRPLLRRRHVSAALLGAALVPVSACSRGPRPVATDPDLARDPLASLDPALWGTSDAGALVELPIEGDIADYPLWEENSLDDASVSSTKRQLVDFLEVAYLSPKSLEGRTDDDTLSRINGVTPEFWQEDLSQAWDEKLRYLYAYVLAEPFVEVGTTRIAASWYRAQGDDAPQLAMTCTIARTVINTETRDVGVVAQHCSMNINLGDQGEGLNGNFMVSLHGVDVCATEKQGGLIVPAIAADPAHQSVQQTTMDQVIANPRISRSDLESDIDEPLEDSDGTVVLCE